MIATNADIGKMAVYGKWWTFMGVGVRCSSRAVPNTTATWTHQGRLNYGRWRHDGNKILVIPVADRHPGMDILRVPCRGDIFNRLRCGGQLDQEAPEVMMEKRTCGNCWWWSKPEPLDKCRWGSCGCPMPMCVDVPVGEILYPNEDATDCPCWRKRWVEN